MNVSRTLLWVLLAAFSWGAGSAGAAEAPAIELPTQDEVEDIVPEGESLSGRELYERFLENRQFHTAVVHQTVVSNDPGGGEQSHSMMVRYKNYKKQPDPGDENLLAKTVIKVKKPHDMRHTGVLLIANHDRTNQQFVYQPSTRRVRRVKLAGVSLMGSDFSYDDISFFDIESADYLRMPDEFLEGVRVYVVEANMKPFIKKSYVRSLVYLEKDHYVPLRQRFFDRDDVEIRLGTAVYDSIREFDGVWVATDSEMHNLRENTTSRLYIEKLEPNTRLGDQLFSTFRLTLRR